MDLGPEPGALGTAQRTGPTGATVVVAGQRIELPVGASRRAAAREFGGARRVERVCLIEVERGWVARVTAVWHRVPWTVDASLPAAVALIHSGAPATLRRR